MMNNIAGSNGMTTFSYGLTMAALVLPGCAAMEAQKRSREYEGVLEPMVGKAQQDDVVLKFGEPLPKDLIGSIELSYYHISYKDPKGAQGSKSQERGYAVGPESERFDDLTIESRSEHISRS